MRLGIEFSTFNGWVLLGLDGLGLRPLVQRHLAMGTRGGACGRYAASRRGPPHGVAPSATGSRRSAWTSTCGDAPRSAVGM